MRKEILIYRIYCQLNKSRYELQNKRLVIIYSDIEAEKSFCHENIWSSVTKVDFIKKKKEYKKKISKDKNWWIDH